MISVDYSVFLQIINFLLLIWLLNTIVYKPIRKILIQRKEKISGLELDIEKSSSDAKMKDDQFGAGIREAREKGLQEKQALIQVASEEEKAMIGKINQKAQQDLAQIKEKVKKDAESVRAALQKEVGVYAESICQKILGRAV
jgi:F-type H+-transporting ATPase subunit b